MVSWALDAKVDRFGTVFVQELTAAAGRAGEVPVPQANRECFRGGCSTCSGRKQPANELRAKAMMAVRVDETCAPIDLEDRSGHRHPRGPRRNRGADRARARRPLPCTHRRDQPARARDQRARCQRSLRRCSRSARCGALTAAKILAETAGIEGFKSPGAYARHNGSAPLLAGLVIEPVTPPTQPQRQPATERRLAPHRPYPDAPPPRSKGPARPQARQTATAALKHSGCSSSASQTSSTARYSPTHTLPRPPSLDRGARDSPLGLGPGSETRSLYRRLLGQR
jgi:hypothetical protein